jgi:hypothetical protein
MKFNARMSSFRTKIDKNYSPITKKINDSFHKKAVSNASKFKTLKLPKPTRYHNNFGTLCIRGQP